MPEVIEFVRQWFAEVESTPGRLRQVAFRRGERLRAEVCNVKRVKGSGEVADLRLADGTTVLHVPLSLFTTVQGQARAA